MVEALLAAAIVAGVAGAFYQLIASDARVAAGMADRRMALLVAQSALDLASVDSAGIARGESAGYRWQARRDPYRAGGWVTGGLRIDRIEVRVSRPGAAAPLVTLSTLVARP